MHYIADFLTGRRQSVKLSQDCHSEWEDITSRVLQGTKLGTWLFTIMINDLSIGYLHDITISETVLKNRNSKIQQYVYDLSKEVSADRFQLNEIKHYVSATQKRLWPYKGQY